MIQLPDLPLNHIYSSSLPFGNSHNFHSKESIIKRSSILLITFWKTTKDIIMILIKSPRVLQSLYLMMTAGSYFKPVVASAVTPFETNADLKTAVEQYCNGTFVSSSVYGWVVVGSIKPCLPTRCTSTQFVSKTASQTASKSHSTSVHRVHRRIEQNPTWPQHDTAPLLIPNVIRLPFFIQDYTSQGEPCHVGGLLNLQYSQIFLSQPMWQPDSQTLSPVQSFDVYFHLPFFYYFTFFTNNNHFSTTFFFWQTKNGIFHRSIEEWDVSKITSMNELFFRQETCNPDISQWNTSSVTNFVSHFADSISTL